MKRALLCCVLALCSGCTLNIYWTDAVVYGTHHTAEPRREPIPLELKVKP